MSFIAPMLDYFTHIVFLTDIKGIDSDQDQVLNVIKCFRSTVINILESKLNESVQEYVRQ